MLVMVIGVADFLSEFFPTFPLADTVGHFGFCGWEPWSWYAMGVHHCQPRDDLTGPW